MTSNTSFFKNKYTSFELIYLSITYMPCAFIFHGLAALNPAVGSHSFVVWWESIRPVTCEAPDPMNRCNRQLLSHVDPAIVVIMMIHQKNHFRQFISYNLVFY